NQLDQVSEDAVSAIIYSPAGLYLSKSIRTQLVSIFARKKFILLNHILCPIRLLYICLVVSDNVNRYVGTATILQFISPRFYCLLDILLLALPCLLRVSGNPLLFPILPKISEDFYT